MPSWQYTLPAILLGSTIALAGCTEIPSGTGSGSSSSSELPACTDAAQEEALSDILTEIEAGEADSETQNETIDLGDRVTLLPILGTDGKCTVNPADWVLDCSQNPFQAMRHQSLMCRPMANGVELVRPADEALPENIILTIRIISSTWNGPQRTVERSGDDSIARVTLYKTETTEDEEGNTQTRCVRDNRHIEVRGSFVFEKAVDFVVRTLNVSQPCTP